jgi:hypothetical protein
MKTYWGVEVYLQSRDSSVGIALGYGLDDRGSRVRFPVGAGNFSLHHRVQNGSGAYPASYPRVPGALSRYAFMAWCLVRAQEVYLHAFLTSALDGGERLASRPVLFTAQGKSPWYPLVGVWVGPRAVLDAVVKRKIPSPCRDSNSRSSSP